MRVDENLHFGTMGDTMQGRAVLGTALLLFKRKKPFRHAFIFLGNSFNPTVKQRPFDTRLRVELLLELNFDWISASVCEM